MAKYSLGFDFGTESVRVIIVDIKDGRIAGQAAASYLSGVIDDRLPTTAAKLPPNFALQNPRDWLDALSQAMQRALAEDRIDPKHIVGIGVDFTSCTMLPCKADSTPLCQFKEFAAEPHAWPKLWKHHGAKAETVRINRIATERKEPWLARYGGNIGLEWFFPKTLEILNHAPQVYEAADVLIEAGDWIVWRLTGQLTRSTCQAGYKAMWNAKDGFPSREYFAAVHRKLADVVATKMKGELRSPGRKSGVLSRDSATLLHLREGIPVSAAIIDAHSGVPGAGVASPSTMVMVLGTSSCHMLNSRIEQLAPGIAGVVEDGILPGYFGYETGQAAVGDAFAWLVDTFKLSHDALSREAAKLPPGSNGVMAIDWWNGCRTPLMDPNVSGAFVGLTLGTKPEQLYRALIESTAFGVKWIVETLQNASVPVRRFVASGGLPNKSPLLMQIYADVLGEKIAIAESDQSCALGAAILGCLAAGSETTGYAHMSQAIHAMARQREDIVYRPDLTARRAYEKLYPLYRQLTAPTGPVMDVMHKLRDIAAD